MRDIFFTIITVWVIYKIIDSFRSSRTITNNTQQNYYQTKKEGETTVNHIPPKNKNNSSNEGEYVDYEELK